MNALTIALLILSYAIGPATLDNGRCSHCKRIGLRSRVYLPDSFAMPAIACSSYYDEDGALIDTCDQYKPRLRCSRGHEMRAYSLMDGGWIGGGEILHDEVEMVSLVCESVDKDSCWVTLK